MNDSPTKGADRIAGEGLDLLRVRPVRAVVTWRWFPWVLRVALLAVFVGLAALSWGVHASAGVNAKLFAKSHLATLLVWGVWWPAMVWVAVWFGRVWCAVCPLELVSRWSERLAATLSLPRRPLPRWIAAGAIIVGLYAVIQLLVAGAHLNRVPAYTSFFLVGLFSLAVVTGLFFRDRAFCRGFCPVGLLLGVYGRGGMIAVRSGRIDPGNPAACPDARVCPSLLNPSKLETNAHCLVCCRCIKNSAPGTMRLLWRRPFAAADRRESLASWPVTLFVMLVFGFVTGELCTEWPAAEHAFFAPPARLAEALAWPAAEGWIEGIWMLFVVPLAVWSALGGLAWLLGERDSLFNLWRKLALPMVVVIAAGHLSKGLAKFVSWAPFVPGALREPNGARTAMRIAAHTQPAPLALLPLSNVGAFCLAMLAVAVIYGIREQLLANPSEAPTWRFAAPLVLIGLLFGGIVAGWAWSL